MLKCILNSVLRSCIIRASYSIELINFVSIFIGYIFESIFWLASSLLCLKWIKCFPQLSISLCPHQCPIMLSAAVEWKKKQSESYSPAIRESNLAIYALEHLRTWCCGGKYIYMFVCVCMYTHTYTRAYIFWIRFYGLVCILINNYGFP